MITARELADLLRLPPPTVEQLAVIEAPLEPSLVVAGAGSGKTETMAARVVYLVATGQVRPEQVLGLTFTRKAAAELAQRVRRRLRALEAAAPELLAAGLTGEPEIWTYHAFGGRLIAEFGPLLGIGAGSAVLTETAAWQLARRVVGNWDGELELDLSPDLVTERLLDMSATLADHLAGPDDLATAFATLADTLCAAPPAARQRKTVHSGLERYVKSLRDRRWIVSLARALAEAKRAAGVVDFADQMQLAAALVGDHPRIGRVVRERHRVVLLDEYQDTGHAQRVLLRCLFGSDAAGAGADPGRRGCGHPVTAVGDPVQSIYSWRGASVSNLPRFPTDFPDATGRPAQVRPLLTSFRNPPEVLRLANAVSLPLRAGSAARVEVDELRPRPGAAAGLVRHGLFATVTDEDAWVAARIHELWTGAGDADRTGDEPRADAAHRSGGAGQSAELPDADGVLATDDGARPSAAVLVRRRSDMAGIAAALRARGLPVQVVGLGGLLLEPEIADLMALLRVLVDASAGPAAIRLLTGARWRIGPADLASLHRRARALTVRRATTGREAVDHGQGAGPSAAAASLLAVRRAVEQSAGAEDIDAASLVDAITDLGDPRDYSAEGHARLARFAGEVQRLRGRLGQPLTDLIADLERTTGLDIEAQLWSPVGRAHLDAFAGVVADLAAAGAGPRELLDYLTAAIEREDGLEPGEPVVTEGCVQVLTVHAAKGLEWDIVAVPHLAARVFPSERGGSWLTDASQLPPELRGDRADVPALELPPDADQGMLAQLLAGHLDEVKAQRLSEERRLLYVAVTRAGRALLLSAHHWSATAATPAGPSAFFAELAEAAGAVGPPDVWVEPPAPGTPNPLTLQPRAAVWPVDPLGSRRPALQSGADAVLRAIRASAPAGSAPARTADQSPAGRPVGDDPFGWASDVDALLADRSAAARPVVEVALPGTLSVSSLVELAADPADLARRLRRPVPVEPAPSARRGTAFHQWLERRFTGDPLLDLAELPGAGDAERPADDQLEALRAAFLASAWADRIPEEVEVSFATTIAGLGVHGRIDAVFAEPDGGYTIVDWKTGRPPSAERVPAISVQLACYRLAFAALRGLPLDRVRAAFHYVAAGVTLTPVDLLDAEGLARLVASATGSTDDGAGPGGADLAHGRGERPPSPAAARADRTG